MEGAVKVFGVLGFTVGVFAFGQSLPLGGIPVTQATCSSPVVSLVQQNNQIFGSCTSCTVTITSAPANGDVIVLAVLTNHPVTTASTISSVTSTNTTWTRDSQNANFSGTHADLELWHGIVSGGAGGTSVTVVVSASLPSNSSTYNVSEWSGVNTSTTVDGVAATATSTSNTVTTPSYSTAGTCELVIAVEGSATNGSISAFPGAPYTNLTNPNGGSTAAYNVLSPMGAQGAANWTLSTSRPWGAIILGYNHT